MKKMKNSKPQRLFAMAMVAAMVTSMMPVTAFAEETTDSGASVPSEQSQPTVTVTVTANSDGSETKTTTSESTNADGSTVTETKTENTAADNTKTETNTTTTTKETTTNNENGGTTTTVDTQTESETTVTEPTKTEPKTNEEASEEEGAAGESSDNESSAENNGFESKETGAGDTETGYVEGSAASAFEEGTTTDKTTTTESSESSTDTTVKDIYGRVVEESGNSSGSETTTTTETVTDKYIEDRDDLEKDDYIDGEEKTLENDPGSFSNDGSVDTTTTSTQIDPGYAGDITITLTPGGEGSGSANVDEAKLYEDLLAEDRPESSEVKGEAQVEDVTNDAGEKIGTKTTTIDETTNVVDKKNAAGEVVGYETTKTTTTTVVTETKANDTNPIDPTVETGETKTTTSDPVETINLPERPSAGESKNDAGETTTTTVEDIMDDNGNVVGYNVTTVTKDAFGNEIGSGSESLWGTKTVTVTTKETLETTTTKTEYITTTTTTTDITEGKTVNGAWIESTARYAEAEMGQVTEGAGHGKQTMKSLPTDVADLIDKWWTDLKFDPNTKATNNTTDGKIQYIGHAADSDYYIHRYGGPVNGEGDLSNGIYLLMDDKGNQFFGYCVDLATNADRGHVYEIGNIEDQSYYQGSSIADAEQHIRAIALNGYWGTASGTGSLDDVKQFLKDSGYANWDTLTHGQALSATQAAIWNYGNNDGNRYVYDDVVRYKYGESIEAGEIANIQALYQALLDAEAPAEKPTNILDAGDILSSQITIGEKVENNTKNTDNNANNDVFNAGVSFTVAIVPTDKDQLKVVVKQGDKEVGSMNLTAANGTQDGNGNTTYTLNNLQLQENLSINLSLDGTQHLKQGVYLYTATVNGVPSYTASQTFVGVGEGTHSVALDVNMSFAVTDETAAQHNSSGSNSRSRSGRKVTQKTDTEINQEVVALMEVTTVTVTEHNSEWEEEYKKTYSYDDSSHKEEKEEKKEEEKKQEFDLGDPGTTYVFDEDIPLAELPDVEIPLAELPDEEIPLGDFELASAPRTGDASNLWLALSGFSGLGLAALFGRKRR